FEGQETDREHDHFSNTERQVNAADSELRHPRKHLRVDENRSNHDGDPDEILLPHEADGTRVRIRIRATCLVPHIYHEEDPDQEQNGGQPNIPDVRERPKEWDTA